MLNRDPSFDRKDTLMYRKAMVKKIIKCYHQVQYQYN